MTSRITCRQSASLVRKAIYFFLFVLVAGFLLTLTKGEAGKQIITTAVQQILTGLEHINTVLASKEHL